MKYKLKYIYSLLIILIGVTANLLYAQYPGGVSSGTTRGYKVDYYNGTFSAETQFGAGTSNAVPGNTGYTNKISGTEFNSIDADYYGMEYTGTLEITTSGNYTFQVAADDRAWLFIDNSLVLSAQTGTTASNVVNLAAGDHTIRLKYYELGGTNSASLQLTAVPAGATGFTLPADVDGRFVRTENTKLTAWYKASDIAVTANYNGAGIDKVNTWVNKAPDYAGNGNLSYSGGGSAQTSVSSLVNFNPGVRFDGDDNFSAGNTQKGLSYRGATKSMFMVTDYASNVGQSAIWMFYHDNGTANNNKTIGFYKSAQPNTQLAVSGGGANGPASVYTANEPKLLGGFVDQVTGASSAQATNPLQLNINGSNGTPANIFSDVTASSGLTVKAMNTAYFPEAIYYPFKLDATQEKKVNSYLAVKYGITLSHDYLNTSGNPVFSLTTNAGYTNRIFGLGRENNEALYQKQSQSQLASAAGYDFLVISKDTDITTTNALNNGTLTDGSYLLMGDNNGAFTVNPSISTPASFPSTCTVNALTRIWKVQNTGSVTSLSLRAGSSTAGSFVFPGNAANIAIWVDTDGDGNFANATVVSASSVVNGVATFKGVNLPNGSVFTFGWNVTSPGGVSTGLKLWAKADDSNLAIGNVGTWYDLSPGANNLSRTATNAIIKVDNKFNYNPSIYFRGGDNEYMSSSSQLGMNGINKYAEFYVLDGNGGFTSGAQYDEIITLGGGTHRWENSVIGLAGGSYGVYGSGTAGSATGSGIIPTMNNLGLYSNSADGINAILRTNGTVRTTNPTAANLSLTGNFRIGTDVDATDADTNWNNFYSPELIVYNTALSATQITQVNSYLGIKYSIPLADGSGTTASNYLASDGTTMPWVGNAVYKYGMFGIGRDDCSGLNQRQSKAYVDGTDIVAFGLTALATNNAANTGSFATNRQFIMVANDNGALAATTTNIPLTYASCNATRYARSWKVKNTGSVNNALQITIGNAANMIPANWNNVALAIDTDGDGNFATGTTSLAYATNILGGVATFDNVVLNDGVVFTVVSTIGFPGGISKPTGTSVAATIAGVDYMNGLAYKMYTTNGTSNRNLGTTPFADGSNGDVLRSAGYYNNATSFNSFASTKSNAASGLANFGLELKGKLNISSTLSTYRFQLAGDDQAYFEIRNSLGVLVTTLVVTANTTASNSTDIALAAGYYDIIVRGANIAGVSNFDLKMSTNSGGAYSAIADNQFFTPASGPSAWYEADDSLLAVQADNANMSGVVWHDLSGNGNDVTGNGNPIYYSTTTTNTGIAGIRNYNPSIYFTADYFGTTPYISGFAYGNTGKSLFTVASNNNNGTETIYSAFGRDNGTGVNFGLSKLTNKFQLFTANNNLNDANIFYNSTAYTTDIISAQLTKAGGGSIYGNGFNRLLPGAVLPTLPFSTNFNDNDQLQLGSGPDYTGKNYTGNMNELIYYPWDLSATERQKVNSYLSIKWGTTLDQTTPTDYLASDGATIWNASVNTAFKNDITGIGRDDCGNLNQKQSTSTDGNDIVTISKGAVATTNAYNANNFENNKSFVILANNNAANSFTNFSSDVPVLGAPCYKRLNREWLVQTTGMPGPINLVVGKNSVFTFSAATFRPALLISNTAGSYAGATVVQATRISQGMAYFDNVTMAANQYFTFAFIEAGPGGVTNGLTTWFNSDYGVFTDVDQINSATNDGDVVKLLSNLKNGATFSNVQSVGAAFDPIYKVGSFNYNNGTLFDGVNDVMATVGNINSTDYRTTTTMTSVFTGKIAAPTGQVFWFHDNGGAGTIKTSLERVKGYWSSDTTFPLNRTPTLTTSEIYTFANTVSTGYRLYSNLATVGSGIASGATNVSGRFRIGNDALGTGGSPANFYLGEFAIYSDDKGNASSLEMRKIHSYMATKYGFTLDKTAMGGQYIASNGTATYNDTNYWNHITGIGRDDCSALEQKQSFSQEATGALVKISNDPVNGLAISNAANTASFAANNSFLLFGDNNKSLTWEGVSNIVYSTNNLMKLNRVWRVKETGATANPIGTVFLQVPASTSTATDKLPVPKNSPNDPIYLIVSNAASGGSFSNATVVPMIPNGTDWTVTYDFTDGDYYTFATLESCLGPAGITDGLTSWYRASTQATGAITSITDEAGSNSLGSKVGAGTINVTAGSATVMNYNKAINFPGNAYLETTAAVGETALTSSTEGSMYLTTLTPSPSTELFTHVFGISRPSFVTAGFASMPYFGNSYCNFAYYINITNNKASFIRMVKDATAGTLSTNTNGRAIDMTAANSVTLAANATNKVRLGAIYESATISQYTGIFGEAFSYNRALTVTEKQVLDSYLAIKNGQTMEHNYFSPSYNGTNAATTTIYDVSSPYVNRIFGVGNDVAGCFSQNQSTSSNDGSMVKISVDGAILAENSQDKTKWLENRSYVVMGDNGGALPWVSTSKPKLMAGNNCALRTQRQWKVTATGNNPDVFITVAGDYNGNINPGAATAKLPSLVSGNSVYMIISDKADFTDPTAVQTEVAMTYNTVTKEWEAAGNTFVAGTTRYITFIQRPAVCGKKYIITNPATSTQQLKQ